VNNQDGSMERLESPAAGPNIVSDVCHIAQKMFERQFSWFDHCDPLVVEGVFPEVRLFYVGTNTSGTYQLTFVDCRFHLDSRQLWIGSIQVATCHRLQGVGRQLVQVVEATANALEMEEVRILPRPSSVDFWLKLDYVPDPRTARVLRKNLTDVAWNQTSGRANGSCTSRTGA
jgi:hypothetical protein